MTEGGDEFGGESERRGRTREWEEAERPRVERESGDREWEVGGVYTESGGRKGRDGEGNEDNFVFLPFFK